MLTLSRFWSTVPGVEHARRRPLTAEEKERYKTGRFLTDRQLEGCGVVTRMSREIAESYARDPSFLRVDVLRRLPRTPAGRGVPVGRDKRARGKLTPGPTPW